MILLLFSVFTTRLLLVVDLIFAPAYPKGFPLVFIFVGTTGKGSPCQEG
jgi:hypothetical protein